MARANLCRGLSKRSRHGISIILALAIPTAPWLPIWVARRRRMNDDDVVVRTSNAPRGVMRCALSGLQRCATAGFLVGQSTNVPTFASTWTCWSHRVTWADCHGSRLAFWRLNPCRQSVSLRPTRCGQPECASCNCSAGRFAYNARWCFLSECGHVGVKSVAIPRAALLFTSRQVDGGGERPNPGARQSPEKTTTPRCKTAALSSRILPEKQKVID